MDDDAVGQRIAKAREVYYCQNIFVVRSHWLRDFIEGSSSPTCVKPVPIGNLVWKIKVIVDLGHPWEDGDPMHEDEEEISEGVAARDLKRLFVFVNAERTEIEIRGGGAGVN